MTPIELRGAILRDRAALIGREAEITARAQALRRSLVSKWLAEVRAAARRGDLSTTGSPSKDIARLLASAGELTIAELRAYSVAMGEPLADISRSTAYRQAYLISKVKGSAAVDLSRAMLRPAWEAAARASLSSVLGQKHTNRLAASVKSKMKADLVEAVASGRPVDWLESRWRAAGAASALGSGLAALSRSAIHAAASESAAATYRASGVVSGVRHEATFDVRTCVVCSSQHGRYYRLEDAPTLPLHLGCRCTYLPVLLNVDYGVRLDKFIGDTRGRGVDPEFERWLRRQPADTRADFFPSRLKRHVFEVRSLGLRDLVRTDYTVKSDIEVRATLRRLRRPIPAWA